MEYIDTNCHTAPPAHLQNTSLTLMFNPNLVRFKLNSYIIQVANATSQVFLMRLRHYIIMKTLNEIIDSFCKRINEIRAEKGWTIQQFADYVQIPRSTINSWLLKYRTPKIDLLYKIADAFGVTIDYLLGREE